MVLWSVLFRKMHSCCDQIILHANVQHVMSNQMQKGILFSFF